MSIPKRGEIWSVDLNPVRGHELAGRRPCLVVSDDLYNAGPAEKHIVIPITSKDKGIPTTSESCHPRAGCDGEPSDVRRRPQRLAGRLVERSGAISRETIGLVKESLRVLLGM